MAVLDPVMVILPQFFYSPVLSSVQGETGQLASELSASGQGRREVVENCVKKVSAHNNLLSALVIKIYLGKQVFRTSMEC